MLNNKFNEPILFLIFNRLNHTIKSFSAIKQVKPPILYISSDGPRINRITEKKIVIEVRKYVLENIDWPCEVFTKFNKNNLGCGPNVKSSIDWFFENEDKGIIIEDDSVAEPSFFFYCQELLSRYQNDNRIGMVCGTNHITKHYPIDVSYTFSNHKACWGGWATWKRAWNNMDYKMKWLSTDKKNYVLKNMGKGLVSYLFWLNAISLIKRKAVSAWDWQWYFSIAAQGQLSIFPKCNLIANIGFGKDATHTNSKPKKEYLISEEIKTPLIHPKTVSLNNEFDSVFTRVKITPLLIKRLIPKSIKRFMKHLIYN